MNTNEYFKTPIWAEQKIDFVKSLNKFSNNFSPLIDNNFLDFRKYVGAQSWNFLDSHGYDMSRYVTMFTDMRMQQFNKNEKHYYLRSSSNQHVSGFYFLKTNNKSSYPIFHDPRNGASATKLVLKPEIKEVVDGTDTVHYKPQPGTLIIFPSYLKHEFSVSYNKENIKFISWHIQAIPKGLIKDA